MDFNVDHNGFSDDSEAMDLCDIEEVDANSNYLRPKKQLELQPKSNQTIYEIPFNYRHIFRGFSCFNSIQTKVFDDVFHSDEPIVVSAPTGSGKTVLFELAIIRLLIQMEQMEQEQFKIIYLAPLKALCTERLYDWRMKFQKHNVNIIELTGDSDELNFNSFQKLHIILTTPEKWDSLTRRWRNQTVLVEHIKLFMIDEIHLLNEDNRGSTLETVICRMKSIQSTLYGKLGNIRMIAVSATIPNTEDVAMLLKSQENPAKFFKFDESYRPVKLKKIVLGYSLQSKSSFQFDLLLNYKLRQLIIKYSEGKPTLIFCSTRRSVEMTSKILAQEITFRLKDEQKQLIQEATKKIQDHKLQNLLVNGIGVHHGGLEKDTRNAIEDIFRKGCLPIIVTTSTLSMGINLPAHLVIVKSTDQFKDGMFQSYSESSILQMIGRAGRPQFDTSATAIILTKMSEKERYENLINGTEFIESNLHKHLVEHINAEVVLSTITDLNAALDWIRSTFLYIRALKNPKFYSISTNLTKDKIEKKLLELFKIELNALVSAGMLTLSTDNNFEINPTDNGILMAKYYITFQTMKLFIKMKGNESLAETLSIICKCHEFSDLPLRVSDKKTLNVLNSSKHSEVIRFPMDGKIKTHDMKVNCIIQATFGCLSIADFSLKQESLKIMKIGERLTKALSKYFEQNRNCFSALLNAIILNKCFHAQLWDNSLHVVKQLPKIGMVFSSMLVNSGKTSFEILSQTNPRDIERIIGRSAPIGCEIKKYATLIPKFEINVYPKTINFKKNLLFEVSLKNGSVIQDECTLSKDSVMVFLIGNSENEVLYFKRISLSFMLSISKFTAQIGPQSDTVQTLKAIFISEEWVGIDCSRVIKMPFKENEILDDENELKLNEITNGSFKKNNAVKKNKENKREKKKSNTEIQKKNKKAKLSDSIAENKTVNDKSLLETNFKKYESEDTFSNYYKVEDNSEEMLENLDETDFEISEIFGRKENDDRKIIESKGVKWEDPVIFKMKQEDISENYTEFSDNNNDKDTSQTNNRHILYQNQTFKNEFIINIGISDFLKDLKDLPEENSQNKDSSNVNKQKRQFSPTQPKIKPPKMRLRDLNYLSSKALPALNDENFEETNMKLYDSSLIVLKKEPNNNCLMISGQYGDEVISKPIADSQIFQPIMKKRDDLMLTQQSSKRSQHFTPDHFMSQSLNETRFPELFNKNDDDNDELQSKHFFDSIKENEELKFNYRTANNRFNERKFFIQQRSSRPTMTEISKDSIFRKDYNEVVKNQKLQSIPVAAKRSYFEQLNPRPSFQGSQNLRSEVTQDNNYSAFRNPLKYPYIQQPEFIESNSQMFTSDLNMSEDEYATSMIGKQFLDNNNNNNEILSQMKFLQKRNDIFEPKKTFSPFFDVDKREPIYDNFGNRIELENRPFEISRFQRQFDDEQSMNTLYKSPFTFKKFF